MREGADTLVQREAIRELVVSSGRLLDKGRFEDFVGLFAANARYSMEAQTPDIQRNVVWLECNQTELAKLFIDMPLHVRDEASRMHLISVDSVRVRQERAEAHSSFVVFRINIDGVAKVYAIGTYEDELALIEGDWKLTRRAVRLDNRRLASATPLPL